MNQRVRGVRIGLLVAVVLASAGCSTTVGPPGGDSAPDAGQPIDCGTQTCAGGGDSASDVGQPTECGSQTCAPGELCVHRTHVSGTAFMPDGFGCPDGTVPSTYRGFCSDWSESFECSQSPVQCGGVYCSLSDASQGDTCGCRPEDAASTLGCACHGV